jgi:hypothetical protein
LSPRIRITTLSIALPIVASLLCLIPAATSSGAPAERWSRDSIWAPTVQDPQIHEASGISRSTYQRTLAWLHNDSGDGPRFFAVGASGLTKAVFTVRGVHARDWEDMAAGPRHHLWFGDIGDNRQQRDDISVIRVREPKYMRSRSVRGTVFTLRYADGPHNAEALLIRPHSGRLYIATKSSGGGGIYRAPRHLSKHHVNVLHRVASDPVLVTGGDFAPNGKHFVLRTHNWAYFYKRIGGRANAVRLPDERQGEAIGYDRGSGSVRLASEGLYQPIWRVLR